MSGKFLLTINDDPFIRELFSVFETMNVDVFYNVSTKNTGRKKYSELIIKNY